jgi:integrase
MPYLSPPTLTRQEVGSLLSVTRRHPRDHLIISIALGTGLRLGEIVGLNVGDVYLPDGTPRTRVRLRPEIAKGGRVGDVFLPDALLPKLRRFRRYKADRRESLEPDAPLLCSQSRWRISKRRVQRAFRGWQVAAGFDRLYGRAARSGVATRTGAIGASGADRPVRARGARGGPMGCPASPQDRVGTGARNRGTPRWAPGRAV